MYRYAGGFTIAMPWHGFAAGCPIVCGRRMRTTGACAKASHTCPLPTFSLARPGHASPLAAGAAAASVGAQTIPPLAGPPLADPPWAGGLVTLSSATPAARRVDQSNAGVPVSGWRQRRLDCLDTCTSQRRRHLGDGRGPRSGTRVWRRVRRVTLVPGKDPRHSICCSKRNGSAPICNVPSVYETVFYPHAALKQSFGPALLGRA